MNERNDFRQLVDRNLSELRWDERRRQSVLAAIDRERRPIYMKKKWTSAAVLAALVCLMAGVALAASLVYSGRYTDAERADALLAKRFGITENLRSMFTRTQENGVYRYESLEDFSGMPGDYEVNTATGEARWRFDGPEGEGWNAEKLLDVLERCKTQGGYGEVTREARAAAQALGMALSERTPPTMEEIEVALSESQLRIEKAEALASISMEEAEALARDAIQARYGLTDEQMRKLEFVPESSMFYMEGETPCAEPYFFLAQVDGVYTEKDGIYIVDVNAIDGTIEGIVYDSGLLGNG